MKTAGYLLDTDTYSLYLRGHEQIAARYNKTDQRHIYLSDIAVNEVIKGRLNSIKQCESQGGLNLVKAYSYLRQQLAYLNNISIVPYNMEADAHFASYDAKIRRAGTNDCRIAAIARVRGLIVVTANSRHFDAIGCRHENWTRAE